MEKEFQAPAVTVEDLDKIMEKMKNLQNEIDARDEVTTSMNKELNQHKFRAAQYLKDLGREEYDSPHGKLELKKEWAVRAPATDEDKLKLFDWMKEKGIFERYAIVNVKSLNSLYKLEWAAAIDRGEGMEFTMPGIGAPVHDVVPKFKPKKEKKSAE